MPRTNADLDFLKGRLAENLVKLMLRRAEYTVIDLGVARTDEVAQVIKDKRGKTIKEVRFMPDFIVQEKNNGHNFNYLEVKYRANGRYTRKDVDINYPYKNTYFIIVSPNCIQCLHYTKLVGENIEFSGTEPKLLNDCDGFTIAPEIIDEFTRYATQFYTGV
ncbi:MAG: hypothetical protein M0D57_16940 [Sphingobacteriales bacterium JAD_PAG50586_3]|nr:MAG: hypothetical protein M0D57_16940 [Sphingobacteriales bacterium JAD_PAG50586_3]